MRSLPRRRRLVGPVRTRVAPLRERLHHQRVTAAISLRLERANGFIRERFLLEAKAHGIVSFTEFNDRFLAWVEQVCNTRAHAETGQTPIERLLSQGPPRMVEPSLLREAFRWSVRRQVTRTATVSLAGNRYACLALWRKSITIQVAKPPNKSSNPGVNSEDFKER